MRDRVAFYQYALRYVLRVLFHFLLLKDNVNPVRNLDLIMSSFEIVYDNSVNGADMRTYK
jgi:hypothetical protein